MCDTKRKALEKLISKLNVAMVGVETNKYSEMPKSAQSLLNAIDKLKK